ncbi:hypothetical protein RBSH_03677 [Rhodopirellula baltica SH28]|uniref:Uncharacterized protein n=1 Tax=Rhodopirellula baltica SH28 TaxID=993517 RepID=K5DEV4_RHOBT|nr:hypothetical protein RBSH_03677 [Rhodopirellula baltica SH28]
MSNGEAVGALLIAIPMTANCLGGIDNLKWSLSSTPLHERMWWVVNH